MKGFEPVEGELLATSTYEAMRQSVLLFEQANDIYPEEEINDRIAFYCPKISKS